MPSIRRLLLVLPLLAACPATEPPEAPPVNQAPTLSLTEPAADPYQAALGVPFDSVATVTDDGPVEGLLVTWSRWATGSPDDAQVVGTANADAEGLATLSIPNPVEGSFVLSARVNDAQLLSASDEQSLTVVNLAGGTPPVVAISSPQQNADYTAGELIVFSGLATDDGGAANLDIRWVLDGSTVMNTTAPQPSGAVGPFTQAIPLGTHTVTMSADDGHNDPVVATIDFDVVPPNLPPGAPQLAISPIGPKTTDALTCAVTVPSTDPEGLSVSYQYSWLVDGSPSGITGTGVVASSTQKGQQWRCQAVASDGVNQSEPGWTVATILNTAPAISSVELLPDSTPPTVETTFTCAPQGWSDPDSDPPDYAFTWWVNGLLELGETATTFLATSLQPTDSVLCRATPDDGTNQGAALDSPAMTLANAPPGPPTLAISPPSPTPGDDLVCSITAVAVDPEGAAIAADSVSWQVDGVPAPTYDGLWTVPAADTALGEEWTCSVASSDGIDFGAPGTALVAVLPAVGDLVVSELQAEPGVVPAAAGQWFELYNAADYELDLLGFTFTDGAGNALTVSHSAPVPAGAYAIVANNADSSSNGGVPVDAEWPTLLLAPQDSIVVGWGALEVDRLDYDLATFGGIPGHAVATDAGLGAPHHTLNDDPASWCASMLPLDDFAGDFGTPGAANGSCACFDSDLDGDGFGYGVDCPIDDCDDNEAAVNPGATEVCDNGRDDDCEEGELTCACEASDADGDGFGADGSCARIDCDDATFSTNPDATEVCDGVDNDCAGGVDDGFPNLDGDGQADCVDSDADGDGESDATDCDDLDASRSTLFAEVCDTIDNDCDGAINENDADASEPNETLATADDRGMVNGTLAVPTTESIPGLTLHHPGDSDWFQFQVDDYFWNNAWVSFNVTDLPTTGSFVAELWKSEDGGNTWSLRQSRTGNTSLSAAEPRDTLLFNESEDDWAIRVYPLPGSWTPASCTGFYTLTITESG